MPNLLQATQFSKKTSRLLKKENDTLKRFGDLVNLHDSSVELVGETKELKEKINNIIISSSEEIRRNHWMEKQRLPKEFIGIKSLSHEKYDQYSALSMLPQVNIGQFRNLADKFNMVIVPLEYTEIDKLFDTQDNACKLKSAFKYYQKILSEDTTRKYQTYILCPISYYSIWEQIKSDKVVDIYYPEYFDNVFTTIELMIPTQKNLYLASQINSEDLAKINDVFKRNIEVLSTKITSLSDKVDKLEQEFIKQKKEMLSLQQQNNNLANELEEAKLQFQKEINFLYRNIDPVMFAVPTGTNIIKDDVNSLVGLCWGKDIEEFIFDIKGIKINYQKLQDINPIDLEAKMNILNKNGKANIRKVLLDNSDRYIGSPKQGREHYVIDTLDYQIKLSFEYVVQNSYLYRKLVGIKIFIENNLIAEKVLSPTLINRSEYFQELIKNLIFKGDPHIIEELNTKVDQYILMQKKRILAKA